MKPVQIEFNTKFCPNTRTTLKSLFGVLLVGATTYISSAQTASVPRSISLQSGILNTEIDLISQTPHDIVFKQVLILLNSLVDDIIETQSVNHDLLVTDLLSSSLSQTASNFITDYSVLGLDPNLTSAEVSDGLNACISAMEMLNDPDSEISLTLSTKNTLKTTITSIFGELNNATQN